METKQICVALLMIFLTQCISTEDIKKVTVSTETDCGQLSGAQCVLGPGVKVTAGKTLCRGTNNNATCACDDGYQPTNSSCIQMQPSAFVKPHTLNIEKGSGLTLTCGELYFDAQVKYKWKKDNQDLESDERDFDIKSATNADSGTYKCQIFSDKVNSEEKLVVNLKVTGGVAQVVGSAMLVLTAACIPTFL